MARRSRRLRTGRRKCPEPDLSQDMADFLIDTPKIPLDPDIKVPFFPGVNAEIDFKGTVTDERFRVIVQRSGINPRHAKYELMAGRSLVLLRFEIEGPPHFNPGEDEPVLCPHLHRFREGYGDRWAEPAMGLFGDSENLLACLHGFLRYCNAVQVPPIRQERSLF